MINLILNFYFNNKKIKETDIDYVYKTLHKVDNIEIYKKKDIPEHLHYKENVRIGDLVIITKIGYGVYINKQNINWTINSK